MNEPISELLTATENFIRYCRLQRKLSKHTIRAYTCDLKLFLNYLSSRQPPIAECAMITKQVLEDYLDKLSENSSVKTIKRKFACLHSFMNYLEYQDVMKSNPFDKFQLKMREGLHQPSTMTLDEVDRILKASRKPEVREKNFHNFGMQLF